MQVKIADLHLAISLGGAPKIFKDLESFLVSSTRPFDLTVKLCSVKEIKKEQNCGKVQLDEINVWVQKEDQSWSVFYEGVKGADGGLLMRCDASSDWSTGIVTYLENSRLAQTMVEGFLGPIFLKNRIVFYDGLMVHASAILYQRKAILFSAPSGVGKSTQSQLWMKHKGAEIINDDCPILRITEGGVRAYGSPWSGSRRLFQNVDAMVSAVIIVEQADQNSIELLSLQDAILHVLPRCLLPYHDTVLMPRAISIAEKIIKKVPVYKLYCNPNQEAVSVAEQCLGL